MDSSRKQNFIFVLITVLCSLSLIIVKQVNGIEHHPLNSNTFLILHIIAEFVSIIVSFVVFIVGWYGYKQSLNSRALVTGLVFMMVGLFDFMHALSYKGMPDLFTLNTVSKASTYWLLARLVSAVGLFSTIFISPNIKYKWSKPILLAIVSLVFVMITSVIVAYYPNLLPAMYDPAVGQTSVKIVAEWIVIVIFIITIYMLKLRNNQRVLLQYALVVAIFSELCFTIYKNPYDESNMLGHILKVAAYYIIFRALFLLSFERPYNELLQARDRIERSFARIGDALASSLNIDDTLQLISELSADILGSRYAVVMLMQEGELVIRASTGISVTDTKVPIKHTSAGTAVTGMQPIVFPDVSLIEDHSPDCHCQHLDGRSAKSIVSAPIISGREVIGVIEVYSTEKNAFRHDQAMLLSNLGRQSCIAIKNAIAYQRERTVAEMLQASLLHPAPCIPGMDIAVRYVPAEDEARIGGDLYDVFTLDDSHLAVIVGDVCGHGLEAASTMAMMQYTIRGLLVQGMSPSEAMHSANQALIKSSENAEFVTMFASILDTKTNELLYCNAGHHMPVILDGDNCSIYESESQLPLGIDNKEQYFNYTLSLKQPKGLLLYTDGIIEARRQKEFFGHQRLCTLSEEIIHNTGDAVLDEIIGRVRDWSGMFQDDIVMLLVKWIDNNPNQESARNICAFSE